MSDQNPNSIPSELMSEALASAHATCDPSDGGCIHAECFNAHYDALKTEATTAGLNGLSMGMDPVMSVLFVGIHIGYRLAQLASGTVVTPKEKVN